MAQIQWTGRPSGQANLPLEIDHGRYSVTDQAYLMFSLCRREEHPPEGVPIDTMPYRMWVYREGRAPDGTPLSGWKHIATLSGTIDECREAAEMFIIEEGDNVLL